MIYDVKNHPILQVSSQEPLTSSKSPIEVEDSWQSYNDARNSKLKIKADNHI